MVPILTDWVVAQTGKSQPEIFNAQNGPKNHEQIKFLPPKNQVIHHKYL